MKVAYLVNTYPQPSHTFIRREINALIRRGVDVHRFAMRDDRAHLANTIDIAENALTEHILSADRKRLLLDSLTRIFRDPAASLKAWRLARIGENRHGRGLLHHFGYFAEASYVINRCKELGIDHIHAHFGTNAATVAMMAHALGGPTYSFTVHGPEEFDAPEALGLGRKIIDSCFVVAVSSFGRSQLCRWVDHDHWDKIRVVHCGIEPERFSRAEPFPDGDIKLVSVGRLSAQKGQLLLIDAVAHALRERPDIHLTLVGDGEMRSQIEAAIDRHGLRDKVTLTGWLDEGNVRAEIAKGHALIMPSFAEGLPLVIMEAMATGRPVISTYIAGIPELVQNGENGWLVPAGDTDALAQAILALARTSRDRLSEMGLAARERALARHDVNVEAAKLEGCFAACQL